MLKSTRLVVVLLISILSACAGTCGDLEGEKDPRDGADIGVPPSNEGADGGTNSRQADGGFVADAGMDAANSDAANEGDSGPADTGTDMLATACGDGVTTAPEVCDDGNTDDGDYCSADCSSITGSCGDSTIQSNESCDDGNTDDGDYCASDCVTVTGACGDATTQSNESCDDGNTDDGDYCSSDCQTVTGSCGDGTRQSNESCDDGQTTNCTTTHDGGDGSCVPTGTCASGYMLDGNGNCITNNTTGLSTPCSLGTGYTVFKFHYDSGSTSARIDVWDASCSYSFAPNSACNVREVYPGFGSVGRTSQGYPILTSSEYLRVRYSVAGLNFTNATLYVQARSYATASSTNIEAWSPIYGGVAYGPVDNDFVYDWYGIDWSSHLAPSDDPNRTAIQLYAYQGSNSLAVKAVELCVE